MPSFRGSGESARQGRMGDQPADGCVFAENSHVLLAVRLQPHGHPAPGSDGIRCAELGSLLFLTQSHKTQAGREPSKSSREHAENRPSLSRLSPSSPAPLLSYQRRSRGHKHEGAHIERTPLVCVPPRHSNTHTQAHSAVDAAAAPRPRAHYSSSSDHQTGAAKPRSPFLLLHKLTRPSTKCALRRHAGRAASAAGRCGASCA